MFTFIMTRCGRAERAVHGWLRKNSQNTLISLVPFDLYSPQTYCCWFQ